MTAELLAFASAFALVFAVELPDKTMVASLVLTTRYRGLPVFAGVTAAFAMHVTVAALFGGALRLLPGALVTGGVALLFGIGSYLLLREGFAPVRDGGEDASRQGAGPVSFVRAALTSFGVLFAAELGDASQLATVGLAARWGEPLAVGLGSFAALVAVAGIAVLVGRKVRSRIDHRLLHRISGAAFAVFALIAAVQTFA
ncbi:MAG: UPF0016 domain-containing protein [Actinophytocola sp.]|nr:UPF0016 domain-containing protein [Actinophytocola sp.]